MLKLLLCMKYLMRRKIVLLSIIAVALSCGLLISVSSLFKGFIASVETSVSDSLGDVIIGSPYGYRSIARLDVLIPRLEEIDSVECASPLLVGSGLALKGKGDVKRVSIWGIDLDRHIKVTSLKESLLTQKNTPDTKFNAAANDNSLYGFVGIGVCSRPNPKTDEYNIDEASKVIGSKIIIMTGSLQRESVNGKRAALKRKSLVVRVGDVVFSGVYRVDNSTVYLPIDLLSKTLYPYTEEVGTIAQAILIKLKEGSDVNVAVGEIKRVWEDFEINVLGWPNIAESMSPKTSIEYQKRLIEEYRKQMEMLMIVFGVISVGVIFLISCIFYMMILTRQKDIAIIKSFGGGSLTIITIFLSFGLVVGILGSMLGVLFGSLFIKNINSIEHFINIVSGVKIWKSSVYMFDKIPNTLDANSVVWISIASIMAAIIGAIIPAIVASKINPVKILRYE